MSSYVTRSLHITSCQPAVLRKCQLPPLPLVSALAFCHSVPTARRRSDNVLTSALVYLFQAFTVFFFPFPSVLPPISLFIPLNHTCFSPLLTSSLPLFPLFLSLPAFAFVSEWERAVPRAPLVVSYRVGHVETLPRPPHPPRIWRLGWHHVTLLCTSAAKLHHRYTTHEGKILTASYLKPVTTVDLTAEVIDVDLQVQV